MARARIAVDIGGTFTDVVIERSDGTRITAKTLTTQKAPEVGFLNGVDEALCKAGLVYADIDVIIHGTTLATNALIERRGATTALLTTHGHRDSLEMAYEHRFEQYDVQMERPDPLVPRWLRLPIRERLNSSGKVLVALDTVSVEATLPVLDEENVESVAISFLHAYANGEHEQKVAEFLKLARPDLSVSLASEVAPEIREYERQSTVVANAYVKPLMARYLHALQGMLSSRGFQCPLLLMTSGGGLCTLETARRFPIRLVESGPAGGAVLAASVAKRLDMSSLLSFDMGGTTAKMCLIDDYEPSTARLFEVDRRYRFKKGSGMPVRIPVIEMVEIGAGGGSIGSVDRLGRISVGPESAGSDPGPVAYGNGGEKPTVTDADLVLGKILPEHFAGGSIALDEGKAISALNRTLGNQLSIETRECALGIAEIVDENMACAARAHAVEQGKDIRSYAMAAFGGAAPLHAARLAEKIGVDQIIIPQGAGVGSAIGFLLAPASYEIVKSNPLRLEDVQSSAIGAMFQAMRTEAQSVVTDAAGDEPQTEYRTAFMRYRGQGYEIPVPLSDKDVSWADLKKSFEQTYLAFYGRLIPEMEIEILTWSLKISATRPARKLDTWTNNNDAPQTLIARPVLDPTHREMMDYQVLERAGLCVNDKIDGPALIVENQTTTVITAAFSAQVNKFGDIVLTRKQRQ